MDGAELIAAERQRQVTEEGWTPEHDDRHPSGDLAYAAAAYVINAAARISRNAGDLHARAGVTSWPWEEAGFKPGPDPLRSLVKAGALIAAEIDRITRKEPART